MNQTGDLTEAQSSAWWDKKKTTRKKKAIKWRTRRRESQQKRAEGTTLPRVLLFYILGGGGGTVGRRHKGLNMSAETGDAEHVCASESQKGEKGDMSKLDLGLWGIK